MKWDFMYVLFDLLLFLLFGLFVKYVTLTTDQLYTSAIIITVVFLFFVKLSLFMMRLNKEIGKLQQFILYKDQILQKQMLVQKARDLAATTEPKGFFKEEKE